MAKNKKERPVLTYGIPGDFHLAWQHFGRRFQNAVEGRQYLDAQEAFAQKLDELATDANQGRLRTPDEPRLLELLKNEAPKYSAAIQREVTQARKALGDGHLELAVKCQEKLVLLRAEFFQQRDVNSGQKSQREASKKGKAGGRGSVNTRRGYAADARQWGGTYLTKHPKASLTELSGKLATAGYVSRKTGFAYSVEYLKKWFPLARRK